MVRLLKYFKAGGLAKFQCCSLCRAHGRVCCRPFVIFSSGRWTSSGMLQVHPRGGAASSRCWIRIHIPSTAIRSSKIYRWRTRRFSVWFNRLIPPKPMYCEPISSTMPRRHRCGFTTQDTSPRSNEILHVNEFVTRRRPLSCNSGALHACQQLWSGSRCSSRASGS